MPAPARRFLVAASAVLVAWILLPAASHAQGKVAGASALEEEILALERAWSDAIVRHDPQAIAALLAEDYIGTGPTGRVMKRSEAVADFEADQERYTESTFENPIVRFYAEGTVAIVIAGGIDRGTGPRGDFVRRFRYTDIWVKRNGKWQCVASHGSMLPET